jgi:hypothetical protein
VAWFHPYDDYGVGYESNQAVVEACRAGKGAWVSLGQPPRPREVAAMLNSRCYGVSARVTLDGQTVEARWYIR